jgi:hypothetical protein
MMLGRNVVLVLGMVALLNWGGTSLAAEGESSFQEVWSTVTSDPYELPHNQVTLRSFFGFLKNYLKEAATRTIRDRSDLLPRFTKLVHPNGICLAGTWSITEDSPYTGYFAKGSEGLIIARASVALSDTVAGKYRAFGFAGKLFPSRDPLHHGASPTANFFVVDDLGGTLARHYTDVAMTNQPQATLRASLLAIGAATARAFKSADRNPNIRQVYEVAELGMENPSLSHTPAWFQIQAAPGRSIDADDFRDELRLARHGGKLRFDIAVGPTRERLTRIGHIDFTEDVVSDSCDHRLHFHHPKWRSDLH